MRELSGDPNKGSSSKKLTEEEFETYKDIIARQAAIVKVAREAQVLAEDRLGELYKKKDVFFRDLANSRGVELGPMDQIGIDQKKVEIVIIRSDANKKEGG